MEYTTQMNAARNNVITKEMKAVAAYEQMDVEEVRDYVAKGQIVIPANKNHTCLKPYGIGRMLKTKINVNLGTSKDCLDLDMEMEKVKSAVNMGAEAIMDLSSFGDTQTFRRKLTKECPAILGTVPIYDAVVYYNKALKDITTQEWMDVFRMHAEDGVDFMTIHCGINKRTAQRFKDNKRITNIVSRGGSIIFAWMEITGNENPFYERFDEVLDICQKYDVTLSLGDACRPGCIEDGSDISQIEELVTLGELTKRAWEKDVQVMIEGPGHMPLNQIQANMEIQNTICKGAPFYVLGPIVTDVAPGYDHITAAIGGAIAATYGASFLCYVTPAEHLRLPDVNDVKEGIIASKIAAHAADVAKGVKGAIDWDHKMAMARRNLDWETMFETAIDPEKARRYRKDSTPEREDTCTMCGKMCAIRNMNKILNGENVDIMEEE
ncbi:MULTISPECIES: phosphomethylpyrimidine synthase ThiC [Bacillota]|jgi:phosphomethylpyrimidine synthase|uniref:Phosphomethylpyrimidine synthase n=2 Tax=Amedibacillus TaxID=2749846 RepID=A0A7G9GIR0_9FIRM|nr:MULTISPECIES: phosphomethylpyrimidine synthase ThiC [Bacillota]QNM10692.1 phosphomethylpyrimidine synthase ThiC [[Eubacterium] hominis]MCH4285656.1 phosphomethylpyrimidine synthase ThiC [Amedibacillus hominis]RGB54001.1 phosphomethylpyrimidine synthase ThiC [Absiella sp. AM22-9]RGB61240.1 phosphomethylpyrimidine synthase ThiC [Absiella sp. AM10-20]RGB63099.1 phosphomethylpyrimidine synthase ThiC [Absiella sp. AM09-45]